MMTMTSFLRAWLGALVALLALDALWLLVLMQPTYQSYLGALMLAEPKLLPAALFYLLYAGGLVLFAIEPALHVRSWRRAAARGAALGLVAYGTYDLSNLATLRGWAWQLSVIDMLWGAALSASAAAAGFFAARNAARK